MVPFALMRHSDRAGHEAIYEPTYRLCDACKGPVLFIGKSLVYPRSTTGPLPNADLPDDAMKSFNEARLVATDSPRAAAALLRLAIEQLTLHVAPHLKGKQLNDRIGELLKAGLDESVGEMLDSVRVIGNGGVHAGELDPDIDPSLVVSLFELVNEVCDELLSSPKRRKAIFDRIPQDQRDSIDRRNSKALAGRKGDAA